MSGPRGGARVPDYSLAVAAVNDSNLPGRSPSPRAELMRRGKVHLEETELSYLSSALASGKVRSIGGGRAAVPRRRRYVMRADRRMGIRWTHITITVSNIEQSIDFYTSFCGLSVVRDRRLEGGGTVWLGPDTPPGKMPAFLLVLGQGEVTSRMDHLGFQCARREQVDEMAEKGRQLGILVEPPQDFGGVVGCFTMLRDPDGHLVEFTHGQPIEGLT